MSKKSFKNDNQPINPALTYLQPADPVEAQQAYERNQGQPITRPRKERRETETKSRRVQLLMKPSLYKAIEHRASAENTSVNALIHEILEKEVAR